MTMSTSFEEPPSDDHPNTVSLALHSLMQLQIDMIKAISVISDENYVLHPLRERKNQSISKKLYEIKDYLEKEMENVSDIIFSLKEVIVSENEHSY
ncbi:MAG: hypothetical protein ACKOW3_03535 [Hyphomicrobium sp.]